MQVTTTETPRRIHTEGGRNALRGRIKAGPGQWLAACVLDPCDLAGSAQSGDCLIGVTLLSSAS